MKVQRNVTYAAAAEALRAALAKAEELGVGAGVVVTDKGGEIVAAGKTERAGAKAWRGGLMKATAAAGLGRSTEDFLEQRLKKDEVLWRAMSANPETFLVPGGVPLIYDGVAVGAVGVSGGHYADDAKVAQAGADRFAELAAQRCGGRRMTATDDAPAAVVHFDHHAASSPLTRGRRSPSCAGAAPSLAATPTTGSGSSPGTRTSGGSPSTTRRSHPPRRSSSHPRRTPSRSRSRSRWTRPSSSSTARSCSRCSRRRRRIGSTRSSSTSPTAASTTSSSTARPTSSTTSPTRCR